MGGIAVVVYQLDGIRQRQIISKARTHTVRLLPKAFAIAMPEDFAQGFAGVKWLSLLALKRRDFSVCWKSEEEDANNFRQDADSDFVRIRRGDGKNWSRHCIRPAPTVHGRALA